MGFVHVTWDISMMFSQNTLFYPHRLPEKGVWDPYISLSAIEMNEVNVMPLEHTY